MRPAPDVDQDGRDGHTQQKGWPQVKTTEIPTVTVRVRDRSAEAAWGSGPVSPVIRTITISAECPQCGGPRGTARNLNQCDDGAYYSVDVWANPCGHVDTYAAVVRETLS